MFELGTSSFVGTSITGHFEPLLSIIAIHKEKKIRNTLKWRDVAETFFNFILCVLFFLFLLISSVAVAPWLSEDPFRDAAVDARIP